MTMIHQADDLLARLAALDPPLVVSEVATEPASIPDFENAKVGDWFLGIGEITTHYELLFVKRFGAGLKALQAERDAAMAAALAVLAIIDPPLLLSEVPTNNSWKTAEEWYKENLIAEQLKIADVPTDVRSPEFAAWLTLQYRLAMAKGIQLGQGENDDH
ncbi:MAG: hypothetical protein Q7T05_07075 [Dehalococcoidia bacterium]|nr:hypothetical protein [Dehalococcoidia bacterium]